MIRDLSELHGAGADLKNVCQYDARNVKNLLLIYFNRFINVGHFYSKRLLSGGKLKLFRRAWTWARRTAPERRLNATARVLKQYESDEKWVSVTGGYTHSEHDAASPR